MDFYIKTRSRDRKKASGEKRKTKKLQENVKKKFEDAFPSTGVKSFERDLHHKKSKIKKKVREREREAEIGAREGERKKKRDRKEA